MALEDRFLEKQPGTLGQLPPEGASFLLLQRKGSVRSFHLDIIHFKHILKCGRRLGTFHTLQRQIFPSHLPPLDLTQRD